MHVLCPKHLLFGLCLWFFTSTFHQETEWYTNLNYKKVTTLQSRGVFCQQFHPLVFEIFLKFATKRAEMTVKEHVAQK